MIFFMINNAKRILKVINNEDKLGILVKLFRKFNKVKKKKQIYLIGLSGYGRSVLY